MNKVILIGRMTKDAEIKTSGDKSYARFGIAVSRKVKNSEGKYDADFLNCVSFGKTAELIAKYFPKGSPIAVAGRIQTGSYKNKDGQTVYTTDVVVEEFDFIGGKEKSESGEKPASEAKSSDKDDFMNVPDGIDEELPFK